jgi:hypothetical protein
VAEEGRGAGGSGKSRIAVDLVRVGLNWKQGLDRYQVSIGGNAHVGQVIQGANSSVNLGNAVFNMQRSTGERWVG